MKFAEYAEELKTTLLKISINRYFRYAFIFILIIDAILILYNYQNVSSYVSSNWTYLLLIVSFIPLEILIIFFAFEKSAKWFLSQVVSRSRPTLEKFGREIERKFGGSGGLVLDEKKKDFVNISTISFHYVDKEQVMNSYNDYFKEPIVEQSIDEDTREISGGVKGSIPQVMEAKTEGKGTRKRTSTIKAPSISLAEKFRRYQKSVIENNQVILGLELVDIDLSDLNEFNGHFAQLESKYKLKLDSSQIEEKRVELKKKAAEKTIVRLENATGWVLIEGKFVISESSNPENFYKLTYEHPVNEYLNNETNKITIGILLQKDSIEPGYAGNYAQSIGKSITLHAFGKVWAPVDRKSGVWELQISPIAIY
jgi:hypothetical protein